ncbi:hypothetical protein L1887_21815 [Cichorium endivia]|nr:hypothetical protein L1887_21815 [Cichorium endivia]
MDGAECTSEVSVRVGGGGGISAFTLAFAKFRQTITELVWLSRGRRISNQIVGYQKTSYNPADEGLSIKSFGYPAHAFELFVNHQLKEEEKEVSRVSRGGNMGSSGKSASNVRVLPSKDQSLNSRAAAAAATYRIFCALAP